MSDSQSNAAPRRRFLLGDIAPYLEKDQRTLRRWCQLGLVPGARRSRGGHWRIYGTDRASVLRGIRGRVSFGAGDALVMDNGRRHKARRRRENAYPPGMVAALYRDQLTPRQAWARMPAEQLPSLTARSGTWHEGRLLKSRAGLDRARVLEDAISRLREQRADSPDGYARELLEREQSQALKWMVENVHPDMLPSILKDETGAERIIKVPRLTAARLAAILGISRRTLYRQFKGWRRLVFDGVVKDHSSAADRTGEAVTDYDADTHAQSVDAALGWREPDRSTASA